MLGGMFNASPQMPAPPGWLHCVLVDDVNRAIEAVTSGGGRVLNGPMEVPGGDWIAQCTDPQGAMFAVHARKK
jgi:predicted enzyme related to lactoylglutathione lyase